MEPAPLHDLLQRCSAVLETREAETFSVRRALTDPNSGIPDQFTRELVVAAIDPVEYGKYFKLGKMVVTVDESVQFHLKELAK